jgi:hypothetical protein
MKNPWIEKFGQALNDIEGLNNYCLDTEQELIDAFNKTQSTEYTIRKDIYPAAYSANIDSAEVIILVSNPGYDKNEAERGDYSDPERIKNNLEVLTEQKKQDDFTVGYWEQKLSKLAAVHGVAAIREKVAILQYLPYHSEKFKPIGAQLMSKYFPNENYLPSQNYSFYKLKKAVERGALLISTRSDKLWLEVLSNLGFQDDDYNLISTINKRNPTISVGNLMRKENDWDIINSKLGQEKLEDVLILSVLAEGGGAEVFKTKEGLYVKDTSTYASFHEVINDLGSDLMLVTSEFVHEDYRTELAALINKWLKDGKPYSEDTVNSWEITLQRKFYGTYVAAEFKAFKLENIFGDEHKELHKCLEDVLREYAYINTLVDFLSLDEFGLTTLLKEISSPSSMIELYVEKLSGYCLDLQGESCRDVFQCKEENIVLINKTLKEMSVFIDEPIVGIQYNQVRKTREISFSKFSIIADEQCFKSFKEDLINKHLKYSNAQLNIISGKKNGAFESFKPVVSGVYTNEKVMGFQSDFEHKDVFKGLHFFSKNPALETYTVLNEKHRIWSGLFIAFNKTIACGCIYEQLVNEGESHIEALKISGLETKAHLRLSEILLEKYILKDED